jgi:hypothetical protein
MKTFRLSVITAVVLLAAGCAVDAPTPFQPEALLSRSDASCQNVAGTIVAQAVPIIDPQHGVIGFSESGGTVTGDLAGSVDATLYISRVGDDGTLHFTGSHTFEAATGLTLTTSDQGAVSNEGRVHNSLNIMDGGSGMLQTHGTANAELLVELRYHGRVCTS